MTEVQRLAKIMVLKDLLKEYELLAKYNGGTDYDRYSALDMAIRVLQEPKTDVLDKIKAEIDQYLFQNEFGSAYRKEVLQIIDKYKMESEVNE